MARVNKNMKVAALCCAIVGGAEGLSLTTYRDPVGIPTICYGETKGIRMGMRKSKPECDAMLLVSLTEHAERMEKCIRVPVNDNEYSAYLSFAYNTGTANFCNSTLVRKLNDGDHTGACNELLKWDKARSRITGRMAPLPGLTIRRKNERDLCLKPMEKAA